MLMTHAKIHLTYEKACLNEGTGLFFHGALSRRTSTKSAKEWLPRGCLQRDDLLGCRY